MKSAIVTLLAKPRKKLEDVDYFVGFHHLVESLRRHNSELPPIVVFSPDIRRLPPGADQLIAIDENDFDGIENVQMAFGKSVYFKLDIFRCVDRGLDADRIIYFDTDVITIQSVSELWDERHFADKNICGVRESREIGLLNPDWHGRLNAGVMVINRPLLGQPIFESLIELARTGKTYDHGDQGVINAWLTEEKLWDQVGDLPAEYNLPSCTRTHGKWEQFADKIKALHFLGPKKPWRDRPEHEWFHTDTQAIWDEEIKHHQPVPKVQRPNLSSSLHTKVVRLVQRFERWKKRNENS